MNCNSCYGITCDETIETTAKTCNDTGLGRALFSVHDEIVAEVSNSPKGEDMIFWLVNKMEQSTQDFNFKYPLKAVPYGPLDYWMKA